MRKFVPVIVLIATASIFCQAQDRASAIDLSGDGVAIVLAGGMGGGAAGGGMGGGGTRSGMGGMTGGEGTTGGGMGGMTGYLGESGATDPPASSAGTAYYTYQCVTPTAQCSFAAPASLRSNSLRAGARCSCSPGQSDGWIK